MKNFILEQFVDRINFYEDFDLNSEILSKYYEINKLVIKKEEIEDL